MSRRAQRPLQDGSCTPLGRQLYIYPSAEALERPEVEAFVRFYIENIDEIVEAAGFIGLNDEQKTAFKNSSTRSSAVE